MRTRRYLETDASSDADRRPTFAGPWAGRAWAERDDDGYWTLTLEPDGERAHTQQLRSLEDVVNTALADERIYQFYLWSPRECDFLKLDRTAWAALIEPY